MCLSVQPALGGCSLYANHAKRALQQGILHTRM